MSDALTAEVGESEVDELLCNPPTAVLRVNHKVIDAPAVVRATVRVDRDDAEKHVVFSGNINRWTYMQSAWNPMLPEGHPGANYAVFLTKTFIRHRLVLMPKQCFQLRRVAWQEWLNLDH